MMSKRLSTGSCYFGPAAQSKSLSVGHQKKSRECTHSLHRSTVFTMAAGHRHSTMHKNPHSDSHISYSVSQQRCIGKVAKNQ